MAFSDLKNDSLFQKIDLNLTTDFNHSQPATVCTVLNKYLTGNDNYCKMNLDDDKGKVGEAVFRREINLSF